jgi:hypothetical protein
VQDEIYRALVELAESGNYMVIFDKSNESSIIFASPKYDKSDRILKKLGIKPGESVDSQEDDNKNSQNQNSQNNTNRNQNSAPPKSGAELKKG